LPPGGIRGDRQDERREAGGEEAGEIGLSFLFLF
jgi:hypothetical protein